LGVLMLACVLLSLAAALAAIRMDPQASHFKVFSPAPA
jgi:hypothetical protein